MEVWITLDKWPWYQVSSFGHVRSIDRLITESGGKKRFCRGQVLKPWIEQGYYFVQVSNEQVQRIHYGVAVLVCTAFHGDCPKGEECRHLDGNSKNNLPDNLMWGTHKENSEDNTRNGILVGCRPGTPSSINHNSNKPEILLKFKQSALKRWSRKEERQKQSQRTKKYWDSKKIID